MVTAQRNTGAQQATAENLRVAEELVASGRHRMAATVLGIWEEQPQPLDVNGSHNRTGKHVPDPIPMEDAGLRRLGLPVVPAIHRSSMLCRPA